MWLLLADCRDDEATPGVAFGINRIAFGSCTSYHHVSQPVWVEVSSCSGICAMCRWLMHFYSGRFVFSSCCENSPAEQSNCLRNIMYTKCSLIMTAFGKRNSFCKVSVCAVALVCQFQGFLQLLLCKRSFAQLLTYKFCMFELTSILPCSRCTRVSRDFFQGGF